MKKTVWFVAAMVMLTMIVGIGSIGYAQEYAPIGEIEGYPTLIESRTIKDWPANVICWQVVANQTGSEKYLRPQIFRANGASADGITQGMIESLKTIRPQIQLNNYPKKWGAYGFVCKPAGWTGLVDYNGSNKQTTTSTTPPAPAATVSSSTATPLPKTKEQVAKVEKPAAAPASPTASQEPDTQTQLNAIRAKLAQQEKAKVTAAPKAADKPKASAAKPVACASKEDLANLQVKVEALDKTLNGKGEKGDLLSAETQKLLDDWFALKIKDKDYATKADLASAKSSQTTNGWVWVLIGLVLLLVIGTIIALIVLSGRINSTNKDVADLRRNPPPPAAIPSGPATI